MTTRTRLRPLLLFTFLLSLTISQTSFGEQWYHVELIVFETTGSITDEQAPIKDLPQADLTLPDQDAFIYPTAPQTLLETKALLNADPNYSVSIHQAWQQPIKTKRRSKSIAVASDFISGKVQLHKGTYLYATIELQSDQNKENLYSVDLETVRKPYLNQMHRIRSKKLHYFDHPQMGALLQITPIEKPLIPELKD